MRGRGEHDIGVAWRQRRQGAKRREGERSIVHGCRYEAGGGFGFTLHHPIRRHD
jgi:hypothetical protein